jgi:hypothetical protein
VALIVEDVVDGGVGGEKSLRRSGALEPLHLAFPSAGRLMGILGAIIRPPIHSMAAFQAEFSGSGGIGWKPVRRYPVWREAVFLQKLAHQFQRSGLVPLRLH